MRPAMNEVLAGNVVIGKGGQLLIRSPAMPGKAPLPCSTP